MFFFFSAWLAAAGGRPLPALCAAVITPARGSLLSRSPPALAPTHPPPHTHTPTHLPASYHTDPSGTYVKYGAMAIGSGSEGASTALQEGWRKDLTLAEAEVLALGTLRQVMEEKVTATNVDIARVARTYHLYGADEVEAVIARL